MLQRASLSIGHTNGQFRKLGYPPAGRNRFPSEANRTEKIVAPAMMIASNGGTNCLISLLRQNPSSRSPRLPRSRRPFLLRCNPRFPDELPDAMEGRAAGFVRIRLVHRSRTNLDVAPGCYMRPRAIGTNTFTADFCRDWLFIKRRNQPAKLGGCPSFCTVILAVPPLEAMRCEQ